MRFAVTARADGRKPVLLEVREAVEELRVLCRLGHDVKAFGSFNACYSGRTHWPGDVQARRAYAAR